MLYQHHLPSLQLPTFRVDWRARLYNNNYHLDGSTGFHTVSNRGRECRSDCQNIQSAPTCWHRYYSACGIGIILPVVSVLFCLGSVMGMQFPQATGIDLFVISYGASLHILQAAGLFSAILHLLHMSTAEIGILGIKRTSLVTALLILHPHPVIHAQPPIKHGIPIASLSYACWLRGTYRAVRPAALLLLHLLGRDHAYGDSLRKTRRSPPHLAAIHA